MSSEQAAGNRGLIAFFLATTALLVVRATIALARFPESIAPALNFVVSGLVIGLSIFALYRGSSHRWTFALSGLFVGIGAACHVGAFLIKRASESLPPGFELTLTLIQQASVLTWCLGLGAFLSLIIREKNLLPPVAIFLAGFDAFLILSPLMPQAQIAAQNPEIVGSLGLQVPLVQSQAQPAGVSLIDMAYVGPADLFFAATFFCLMLRHAMKVRTTMLILVPVLLAYLIVVFVTGIPLPALVPIGAVVMAVNWNEFKMSAQEKQMTWGVFVVALLLAGWGLFRRLTYDPPPTDLSPTLGVPPPPGQDGSPQPAPGD